MKIVDEKGWSGKTISHNTLKEVKTCGIFLMIVLTTLLVCKSGFNPRCRQTQSSSDDHLKLWSSAIGPHLSGRLKNRSYNGNSVFHLF